MTEVLEGVIHGKTIKLVTDPGLAEGQVVHLVLVRRPTPERTIEDRRRALEASAGSLAHLPDEAFEALERIVAERQDWPHREIAE